MEVMGLMKLIFEDNINTPSSQLLKALPIGCDIEFSCGNIKLLDKAIELGSNKDIELIVIYLDFVLNNEELVQLYFDMIDEIPGLQEEGQINCDIYLITIPCIEYFILQYLLQVSERCFDKASLRIVKNILNDFHFDGIPETLYNNGNFVSVEKILKHYLNNNINKCLINENVMKNPIVGKFYKESCNCEKKYCRLNCTGEKSLVDKAYGLYRLLPFKPFDSRMDFLLNLYHDHRISIEYQTLQRKIQKIYYKMAVGLDTAYYDVSHIYFKKGI